MGVGGKLKGLEMSYRKEGKSIRSGARIKYNKHVEVVGQRLAPVLMHGVFPAHPDLQGGVLACPVNRILSQLVFYISNTVT